MKRYDDVKQGSRAWFDLRLGIPTVSRFPRIVTAAKLQYGKGAKPFIAELLAERILGQPLDETELHTGWTDRGSNMENEAREWYAFYKDVTPVQTGFVTTDLGGIGGSPDSLVDDDPDDGEGGLEIKIRSAAKHMACVLGLDPIAEPMQVQGYLWVTGRSWWDVLAY